VEAAFKALLGQYSAYRDKFVANHQVHLHPEPSTVASAVAPYCVAYRSALLYCLQQGVL